MVANSIFICFRRTDAGWAGRLDDELQERFPGAVFRDVAIPAGVPWREHIDGVLAACRVVLVMIGPSWTAATGPDGVRRLWAEDDVVRTEIERALGRDDVKVIPVLFDGAEMPKRAELPAGIHQLVERQAQTLSDRRWAVDMDELAECIAKEIGRPEPPQDDARRAAVAMLGASAIAGLLAWPVAGARPFPNPSKADPLTTEWIATTLGRVAGIGAHRAILWAFIAAITLGAAYYAMRRSRTSAPAGAVIGLTAGALAGAIGAVLYVALKEANRALDLGLTEPGLNGAGVALTGFLLAGRVAALAGGVDRSSYRVAGLTGGFVAGLLGGKIFGGGSESLGWATQSVVLMAVLAALLAATTFAHGAPAPRAAVRG
jgi:hypothetical protein